MTASDRRQLPDKAFVVDNALLLATQEGISPAIDYMLQKGIQKDVALRVLSASEFRRKHRDHRTDTLD
jgi:hypothetical protein